MKQNTETLINALPKEVQLDLHPSTPTTGNTELGDTTEVVFSGKLNEVVTVYRKRPDGTLEIGYDYSACPTMAEQHTSHLTDINHLMEKYKPDELAQYIVAKNSQRQEIMGHDFAAEPSLQEAKNIIYTLRQGFENLPDDIRVHFKNHVEYLKFIDNPANQEKMLALGLMTKKEIAETSTAPLTTRTQDEKETESKK